MKRTEAGRFMMSKLHSISSADHQCSWYSPTRPGNTNVSVTHFIDESDDSDIFVNHLPDLSS